MVAQTQKLFKMDKQYHKRNDGLQTNPKVSFEKKFEYVQNTGISGRRISLSMSDIDFICNHIQAVEFSYIYDESPVVKDITTILKKIVGYDDHIERMKEMQEWTK